MCESLSRDAVRADEDRKNTNQQGGLPAPAENILVITIEGADFADTGWISTTIQKGLGDRYASIRINTVETDGPGIDLPAGKGSFVHIPYGRIRYVTSDSHYVCITGLRNTQRYHISFRAISQMLQDERFLFCNRGVVLNMDHILREEHRGFLMDDGTFFPARQRRYKEAAEQYRNYLLRRL